MRYTGGVTGYLEALTNETNAFSAELGLAQARFNELLALVQLYQALAGCGKKVLSQQFLGRFELLGSLRAFEA